jgi:hypothetical protein
VIILPVTSILCFEIRPHTIFQLHPTYFCSLVVPVTVQGEEVAEGQGGRIEKSLINLPQTSNLCLFWNAKVKMGNFFFLFVFFLCYSFHKPSLYFLSNFLAES